MCEKKDMGVRIAFDAFIRKCIKNFSIDYERVEGKKWYNNTLFFYDENELANCEICEDWTDELFIQKEIFVVSGIHIEVKGESIINALYSLPEEHKRIILLYFFENFTEKEVSQILNIPKSTVNAKKLKALKLLKEAISKNDIWIYTRAFK